MSALDRPVRELLAEPGRRQLDHLLDAAHVVGGRGYDELYRAITDNPSGTARQALGAVGVRDDGTITEHLRVYARADAISEELCREETRLLESAPPVASPTGDQFARWRTRDLRYAGPEGRQVWQRDLELNPDLPVMLEQQARQARARGALSRRLKALQADMNGPDSSAGEKLRMLDRHRSEGVKELERAVGGGRELVQPSARPGGLRALDANDLAARPEFVRQQQAEINRLGWNN